MSELFHPNLILTKLVIITFIELLIFICIILLKSSYKEKIKIIVPIKFDITILSISLTILLSLLVLLLNFIIFQYSELTFLIFNAAIISILYIEMGIVLSRNFFTKFFDDQLPKEIIYFIGFILMINDRR